MTQTMPPRTPGVVASPTVGGVPISAPPTPSERIIMSPDGLLAAAVFENRRTASPERTAGARKGQPRPQGILPFCVGRWSTPPPLRLGASPTTDACHSHPALLSFANLCRPRLGPRLGRGVLLLDMADALAPRPRQRRHTRSLRHWRHTRSLHARLRTGAPRLPRPCRRISLFRASTRPCHSHPAPWRYYPFKRTARRCDRALELVCPEIQCWPWPGR